MLGTLLGVALGGTLSFLGTWLQAHMARRAVVRDRAEQAAGEILDLLDRVEVLGDKALSDGVELEQAFRDELQSTIARIRRHTADLDDPEVRNRMRFLIDMLKHAGSMYFSASTSATLWRVAQEGVRLLGAYRRGDRLPSELYSLDKYREGFALMAEMDEENERAREEYVRREREERQARRNQGQGGD